MKKLLMALMLALLGSTLAVSSAQAKRLGGGGSFGKQSQSASRSAPAQPAGSAANAAKPAAPAAAPATPPKPASPWRGILGGALLGLGLGALLSHLGLSGAMASMLSTILMVGLLALAAMFVYRMFRRAPAQDSLRPAWAASGAAQAPHAYSAGGTPEIGSRLEPATLLAQSAHVPWGIPEGFDTPAFLRHAKTYFIRLQAAWDRADVDDIREFATPEMFAELRLQIHERGASANHTDVAALEAELLGIETVGDEHLASVRFSGMIKEGEQAAAAPFSEVWNLSKPVSGAGGWLLAGVQQVN